jgi:hypothetical protein
MHKRLAISFFLLLAFAMLLAHNLIPHQHNENNISKHSHHHHHNQKHHHHSDENDQGDNHQTPLIDLTHNTEFGKVLTPPQIEKHIFEKPGFHEGELIRLSHRLASLNKRAHLHPPNDYPSLHVIFLSHSLPLRAPPVLHS